MTGRGKGKGRVWSGREGRVALSNWESGSGSEGVEKG